MSCRSALWVLQFYVLVLKLFSQGKKKYEGGALPANLFPQLHTDGVYEALLTGSFEGVALNLSPKAKDNYEACEEEIFTRQECNESIFTDIADFAEAMQHFLHTRFNDNRGAPRQGENPGAAFDDADGRAADVYVENFGRWGDLRRLCEAPCSLGNRVIALQSTFDSLTSGGLVLPAFGVMCAQLELLHTRLVKAYATPLYRDRWFDDKKNRICSGTVIMRDLFTAPALYEGLQDILFVWQHLALATRCEAVVEGMTKLVAEHADGQRGLSDIKYNEESFIRWNGPSLAESDPVMKEALRLRFGDGGVRFTQTSARRAAGAYGMVGKVMQRHDKEKSKFSFMS